MKDTCKIKRLRGKCWSSCYLYLSIDSDREEGALSFQYFNQHKMRIEGQLQRRIIGQQIHSTVKALKRKLLLTVQRIPAYILHLHQPSDLFLLLPISHL